MFRNGHPSQESQNNFRHRYQAWKEDQRRNGSLSDGYTSSNGLDLSIHIPPRTSGNRFEVLRPPSPTPKLTRAVPLDHPSIRRVRHGRGSKEGKRRRDARRNQRRLQAIQALDEQLSRDLDQTLTHAKISPPRRCNLPTATPTQPSPPIPAPQPAYTNPKPPQLPYFNFSGLDLLDDCPQLTPSRVDSGYTSPSLLTPSVPNWSPKQPTLLGKSMKWSDFPLFFDLSKLPEPALSKPERSGMELQLWRPQAAPPKKRSRFFPSTPSSKATVKLPPTSCKLHADNKGAENVSSVRPQTVAESLEQVVKVAETARKLIDDEESEKNASNLWKILTSAEHSIRGDDNDLYPNNVSHELLEDVHVAPDGIYDHRLESVGMPVELDSTAIPYVHANCLTGHANERGSEPYPTAEEDVTIFEAPANPAHVQDFLGGLNEMVMDPYTDDGYTDALLAVFGLPPLPPSPDPEDNAAITTNPRPIDSVLSAEKGTQTELENSDAHFKSEQALFHPQPLMARTPEDDLVDVETFLKMGHSANCWCNDCGEPPAILEDEAFTDDDGWMVYSSTDEYEWPTWSIPSTPKDESGWQTWSNPATPDGGSVCSAWEWEWGTVVHDEEQRVEQAPRPYQPTWDEAFPCKPSRVAHSAW